MNPIDDDPEDMQDDTFNDEYEKRRRAARNHPVMKSAREVHVLLNTLLDAIEDDSRRAMFEYLREDADIMIAKMASALISDSWLIAIGNAAIVRERAHNLLISSHTLGEFTDTDNTYIKLFRNEMESFRLEFRAWMEHIHARNHAEERDDWGVFI